MIRYTTDGSEPNDASTALRRAVHAHHHDDGARPRVPRGDEPEPGRRSRRSPASADLPPPNIPGPGALGEGRRGRREGRRRPRVRLARPVRQGQPPRPADARSAAAARTAEAANGLPAPHFDGTDDVLRFTTRFDKTIRAVFAVLREDADAGTGPRALLGDASTYDFYAAGTPWWYRINGPYVQTSAYILGGQTWVNGIVIERDGHAAAAHAVRALGDDHERRVGGPALDGVVRAALEGRRRRAADLHRADHQLAAQVGGGLPGAEVRSLRADGRARRSSSPTAVPSRARARSGSAPRPTARRSATRRTAASPPTPPRSTPDRS